MTLNWQKRRSSISKHVFYNKIFDESDKHLDKHFSEVVIIINKKNKKYIGNFAYKPDFWLADLKQDVLGDTENEVFEKIRQRIETYWKLYNKRL